jgi:phosphoribosylaminoimidazolecarboxamide formyltransferase / IMP cyclohydrolase
MPTALLSAFDKTGLAAFALELKSLGWDLLGSRGTAAYLNEKGIHTRDVAEIVGPPILGHKVVTLSREIHAALLADESLEEQEELDRIGVPRINLCYVDLYPLAEETKNPDRSLASILEKTDIGGPTMLRSAAKGRRIVLCKPSQFEKALAFLKKDWRSMKGTQEYEMFLSDRAYEAELHVSEYCMMSASALPSATTLTLRRSGIAV